MADNQQYSQNSQKPVQINPEDEAEKILRSESQDLIAYYYKHADLLVSIEFHGETIVLEIKSSPQKKENQILQFKIEETSQLVCEIEEQFNQLFREKLEEGLHRNNTLFRMESGIKAVSDWMDELTASVKESEEPTPSIHDGDDLESEITELTTLIAQFNIPEHSEKGKQRLEVEINDAKKILAEVTAEKEALNSEILRSRSENQRTIAALESVLASKLSQIESLK